MLIANILTAPIDIGILVIVVMVLFGARRLPELGKNLAERTHEFRKASRKITEEDKPEETESEKK